MEHKEETDNRGISVGLVSPGWPPEALANGIVSYVATLSRALERARVPCHILSSQISEDSAAEPARVNRVCIDDRSLVSKLMWKLDPTGWRHRLFAKGLLNEIRRLHARGNLDLLEVEESFGWSRHLAGSCPVPIVVRLHGPWFLNGTANGMPQDAAFHRRDAWEKKGILAAQAVTAPSRHVLEATRAHYGLTLPQAQVIPNPVDPVAPDGRWNLQRCDRNRIAFIGRFDRHKGGDTMIDAFAYVLGQFPDARLDFVGPDRGCIDDSGREWRIEQYLREKLNDIDREKVTYHGFLPGPAAAEVRKRALVSVAPSRYETFGIAAAEAMMAGCPLVVSASGALTELVQNSHNGLTAAPGDARNIADRIIVLLRDPQRAAELGRQAAVDANSRYAPEIVAAQTTSLYRRILNCPATPGEWVVEPTTKPASVSA